jgi:hypothetical protein
VFHVAILLCRLIGRRNLHKFIYRVYLYSDVLFFRTPYFHSEIADKIQPDILITGNVERYLNSVPSDIERFDMKGLQIEKGCSQDLNFMAALKNILD